jgi:molecular chaperone HtpG
MNMTAQVAAETHGFQADVKQVLDLVIHSLYSNKEIFLRELISNASDANDKLRFLALSNKDLYENDPDLRIQVSFDEKARTVTVADNGIGMTKDEIIRHLGTIAKSGTKEFLSNLSGEQNKDSNLIGQFGVGFYSAFIVADKVTVDTRKAGLSADQGVRWVSKGDGQFDVSAINKPIRGTQITLRMRADENEFLNDWVLRSIVTKYSDHICWPIMMKAAAKFDSEVSADGEDEKDQKAKKADEAATPEEVVNRATALWTLTKNEIEDSQYQELYRHISHDPEAPLTWMHNHVEGKQQYVSLLYVPAKAPFDLFHQEKRQGLKLFIKRVFVMDEAAQFLPNYLRFVRGIIDSADLPLNISREILQDNKLVESIRKACVKRVLGTLEKMAENEPEKYAQFWQEFGSVLKEGPVEDFANKEQIAKLLRFSSSRDNNRTPDVSLDEYIKRMPEGQDKIFYITADSFNAVKNSPHLEIFAKKGVEVLLLHERIDEWLVSHLSEYDGKHLQAISKGELDLGDLVDEKETEQAEADFSSMLEQVKKVLADRVEEVRLTHRLTNSPACVVANAHDMGREMQKLMQAAGQAMPATKPNFELNPEHALIKRLRDEADDDRFNEWSQLLFEQAILAEGGQLEDPAQFVKRLNAMLLDLAG